MFFRLFNTNHPLVFIYLFIYALIIKGGFFFLPNVYDYDLKGLLADPLFQWLATLSNSWQGFIHLFSILMVYTQAIAFNQFLIIDRIIQVQNYIPALIFLTLSSLQPELISLNPTNLGYLFIIPVFYYIFQLPYIQYLAVEMVFYAGLFIGLVSLLYFPSFYLLGPFLIAIGWIRGFHLREFILPLIGFIMPYLVGGVYMYVTDQFGIYMEQLHQFLPSLTGLTSQKPGSIFIISMVLTLTIAGFIRAYQLPRQNIILYQKLLSILLLFILTGLAYFLFVSDVQLLFTYLLLLPISLFVSNLYDVEKPNVFLRWLFWIIVLVALFYQWQYYLQTQGLTVTEWFEAL